MASLTLKNINKTYPGGVTAVTDFCLEVEDREFLVLVGPSGCGKSTVLRMIAGLEDITGGELYIGDRMVNKVSPKNRDIAMVFQNYALYPHMDVYHNMAFGLKMRKIPRDEIHRRVEQTAAQLEISDLLHRKPKALSGGQRQRVALGRAMVRDPAVFLLDEPLSNLDAKLRTAMRAEISQLHKRLEGTFVYVTHDQTEAMTMGDRIVVMKDGLIQQADTPEALYNRPRNLFVAGFIGSPQMNLLPVALEKKEGAWQARLGETRIPLESIPGGCAPLEELGEQPLTLGIRPEHISLSLAPLPGSLAATVLLTELLGPETLVHLELEDHPLLLKAPPCSPAPGSRVWVTLDGARLHLFGPSGDRLNRESPQAE